MERFALILILLAGALASFATSAKDFAFSAKEKDKDEDYPLTAVMGINRGEYPGQYVTELRIGHTIYVSQDVCRKRKRNGIQPIRRAGPSKTSGSLLVPPRANIGSRTSIRFWRTTLEPINLRLHFQWSRHLSVPCTAQYNASSMKKNSRPGSSGRKWRLLQHQSLQI
jgi:hypothetical protein